MKQIRRLYIAVALVLSLLSSCTKNIHEGEINIKGGTNTNNIVEFGYKDFKNVTISTKSALPPEAESRLLNFYLVIFNQNGDRIYDEYFDISNRVFTEEELATTKIGWYIHIPNEEEEEEEEAGSPYGKAKIAAPDVVNGRIYIVGNVTGDLLNLSRSQLDIITTQSELESHLCTYLEPTTFRMASLPNVGYTTVTISENNITIPSDPNDIGTWGPIAYHHTARNMTCAENLDAKVEFNIGIVPGAVKEIYYEGSTIRRTIRSFTPESWQVFNLPTQCRLLPNTSVDSNPEAYFNSAVHIFEEAEYGVPCQGFDDNGNPISTTHDVYKFTFYTLENRQSPKQSVLTQTEYSGINPYHLRDKRVKDGAGKFTNETGNIWEFAPENATYVVIKGSLDFDETTTDDVTGITSEGRKVYADVTYYIHLGDFGDSEGAQSGFDNYNVNRGTHYKYHIDIKGTHAIDYEVQQDNESYQYNKNNEIQSGNEGQIITSFEEEVDFDAHFGQRVYRFNYDQIKSNHEDVDNLTWAVTTPFGRSGMPDRVGPDRTEVPNGLDYQWVSFLINTKNEYYEEPRQSGNMVHNDQYPQYSQKNRLWPGKGSPELLNVIQLCNYLRKQVKLKDSGQPNAFDSQDNIYVTAFIDEFYYDVDPISGEPRESLWKEFVNCPQRSMLILCNALVSKDLASIVVGSTVAIRQHSIQTIYNTKTASDGWGCETIDESENRLFFFNRIEGRNNVNGGSNHASAYNLTGVNCVSINNGLYNSGQLWGIVTGGGSSPTSTQKGTYVTRRWDEFTDYSRPNNYTSADGIRLGFLKDDNEKATLRYSCLSRNRDENGNGIIDPEEIKWYTASLGQLQELYIGEMALSASARLYNVEDITNSISTFPTNKYYTWRNHVISSTAKMGNQSKKLMPQFIWTEEGISVSEYAYDNVWKKPGALSVRCVRNLAATEDKVYDITDPMDYPEIPITFEKDPDDGTYTFDLSLINQESKRIYSSTELVPMDENSISSRPYNKFKTGPLGDNMIDGRQLRQTDYPTIQYELLQGQSRCPEGYRIPNVREMAIVYNYVVDNQFWSNTNYQFLVMNYYSFGPLGAHPFDSMSDGKPNYTWYFASNNITVAPSSNIQIRCVKDVK